MTIISFNYLLFIAAGVLIYYILPKSFQWIELLIMSMVFYFCAATPYTIIYMVVSTVVAWIGTGLLEKIRKNGEKKYVLKLQQVILVLTIGVNILIWFILKGSQFWRPVQNILSGFFPQLFSHQFTEKAAALGMGYYTLQIIGYILDCYWETIRPQKNVLKLFLFVSFFPQLTIGPISRYTQLENIYEKHAFSYQNVTHGMQRILWGFFKKIVLGERIGIIVNGIWADQSSYGGLYLWVALLLYPLQIYADFSGGMDIVLGTSEMFGVQLAENFNNPFFSKTSQEIWQRWHITLGNWAKDYILYPVLKSKVILKLSKSSKKKFGKRIGKFVPTAVGMLILWMVLGIWHGAPKYVIGVSLWYWVILMLGELTAPIFSKVTKFFCIRTESFSWKLFRVLRTYLIFAVGVVFGKADNIRDAMNFLKNLLLAFKEENLNPWIFFDGSVLNLGVSHRDLNIIIFGVLALLIVAVLREKYTYARAWIDQQCVLFRWMIWIGAFVFILIYGMYGAEYSAAEFIYQGF